MVVGNKVITGSGHGGLEEAQQMLDFCTEHNIVSDIELIDMKDIGGAFERLEKGDVRYRFVIDMSTL
ncbi:Aldehyde reductase YahK [compost metagenome]